MMMGRNRIGSAVSALTLLSLLAGATAAAGFDANDMQERFVFRMVPVKSFAADAGTFGDPAGLAKPPRQDILTGWRF